MSRAALLRVPQDANAAATKPARRKAHELARVMLLNPRTIGSVSAAQQLGATLRCRLEGSTLVVEVER